MATLNDFIPVDNVTDVTASWVANLIATSLRSEYKNVEDLSATKTLANSDVPLQRLNCNGANRIVKMPTEDAVGNNPFLIINSSSGSYVITIQNNAGSITLAKIAPDEFAYCLPDGNGKYKVLTKANKLDTEDEATLRQRMDGYADFDYHFDDSSLPAGHSWAGAPFVTPSTVDLTSYPSVMFLQNTTGARSFLYTTTIPTNTSYLNCFINYVPNGKYGFVGVRYDDGTDNNYVELGLLSVVATWKHRIYYRTGGGSVYTLDGSNDITLPFAITHRTVQWGTKWSSWGVNLDVILPFQGTTLKGLMNKQSASSFAFTATRFGIVLRSDDQFICGIDAYGKD